MSADQSTAPDATATTTTTTTLQVGDPPIAHPGAHTTDRIWLAAVLTCCILLLGAGGALVVGMFVPAGASLVAVELVQSVFLVVFGFICGLLAPTPSRR